MKGAIIGILAAAGLLAVYYFFFRKKEVEAPMRVAARKQAPVPANMPASITNKPAAVIDKKVYAPLLSLRQYDN